MAAHVIGKVQALQGIVQVRDQNGKIHSLMVGDELLEGQTVLTGSGHLTIAFVDGGTADFDAGQTVAITAELSADLPHIVESVDLGAGGMILGVGVLALGIEHALPSGQTSANNTPEVTVPQTGGTDTTVFESGLPARGNEPAGSHVGNAADPVTTSGTVSFKSLDGVHSVSLGGHVLTGTSTTFTDSTGSLTASYTYDAAHGMGTISYSYTLLDNTAGHDSNVSFPVVVTDPQGDVNPTANLVVNIVDDAPTANPGSHSGVEGATLTGNVLTDGAKPDVFGADGPATGGGVVGVAHGSDTSTAQAAGVDTAIAGTYGTLVVHADGGYTYTGNSNTVPPAGATDSFIYTIKDGDGDTSTSTLNIDLTNANLRATNPSITVDEAALSTGSNPSSPAETAGGMLGVTGAVNYSFAVGHDGTGSQGTLTLHANGSYSYTLSSAENSGPVQGANTVNGAETFFYTATDAYGNAVNGTIVVNIKDDAPTAGDDSFTATVGQPVSGSLAGNDVVGADTPGTWALGATGPAHGMVTVNSDGSFTYMPTDTHIGTDSFTYTLTDHDGDAVTATATISNTLVVGSATATVSEQGLPGGLPDANGTPTDTTNNASVTSSDATHSSGAISISHPGSTISTVTLTGPSGITSNGHAVTWTTSATGSGGQPTGSVLYGITDDSREVAKVTIGSNGSYSFTLEGPLDHSDPNAVPSPTNLVLPLNFVVTATNSSSQTSNCTLTINVEDDHPKAVDDSFTMTVGQAVMGDLSLNDVVGADTPGTWALGATGPAHGMVTVNSDGSFTYTPTAGYQGTDSFTYTLTDHDGDAVTATATLTINSNGAPTISMTDSNSAKFGATPLEYAPQAVPDTGNLTLSHPSKVSDPNGVLHNHISGADGWAVGLMAENTGAASVGNIGGGGHGSYGTLTIEANGSYSYVRDGGAPGGMTDIFTYIMQEGNRDQSHAVNYLHFMTDEGITTINISSADTAATNHDQQIVLTGVDRTPLGANDMAIIQSLFINGHLIHDV